MAAQDPQTAENRPRAKPGWMSMPGGPKEPNHIEFRTKIQALNTIKSGLFDQLKDIQARAGGNRDDSEREAIDSERKELMNHMKELNSLRIGQRDARHAKNEEIARVRKQKQDVELKLKELSTELGAFRELKDIDAAIDHIMQKMETGGNGSLSSEKRAVKRLNQLEEAKGLILQLKPMAEAIANAEDYEAELQQEYRAIHERIGHLNKEYEENFSVKVEKDKEMKKHGVDRSALTKEREDVRAKLNKVNEDMNAQREKYNKSIEAWDIWREDAKAKYTIKAEAERIDREKRWKERNDFANQERKRVRAIKRQNPHETEINACSTLVRYLQDRLTMVKRDDEERKRRIAATTFDPTACAPPGAVFVANDTVPLAKKTSAAAKRPTSAAKEVEKRVIQHGQEKIRLFELVKIEAPITLGAINDCVTALKNKQKEFEAFIKGGDMELSSDEEEVEDAAAAATAAPAE